MIFKHLFQLSDPNITWIKKTVKRQRDMLVSVFGPSRDHTERVLNEFRESVTSVSNIWLKTTVKYFLNCLNQVLQFAVITFFKCVCYYIYFFYFHFLKNSEWLLLVFSSTELKAFDACNSDVCNMYISCSVCDTITLTTTESMHHLKMNSKLFIKNVPFMGIQKGHLYNLTHVQ